MVKSSKIHTQKINAVYGHKDFLVSSSDDTSIKIYDYSTLEVVATLTEHKGAVVTLAGTEKYLFSASYDGIKVWTWEKKV